MERILLWLGISAVKWSTVFAVLGFAFIAAYPLISRYLMDKRFSGYRLLLYSILSYGVVAVAVYAFSFFDIYLQKGSFQKILDYKFNMFNYHTEVASAHLYGSAWWTWLADYRPMCYYREQGSGMRSSITAFGNPAIFWMGIPALFYLAYSMFKKRTIEASFILLAFLGMYLPYAVVGCQMFIYHFYYAVPFMMLAIVYMLKDAMKYFPGWWL